MQRGDEVEVSPRGSTGASLVSDCAMDCPGGSADNEKMVQIFGLTHAIVFLALIAIVGIGAVQKLWTWWFLVGTLITTGPPGALVGEVLIARKAKTVLVTSKGETPDR